MRQGVGLLVVFGAVFGVPSSVQAADDAFRNGLSADANVVVLYDSNQLRSRTPGSGHSYDIRYSPFGRIGYGHLLGRGSISLDGLVGHDFFQYNSGLNRNRFGAGGVLTTPVGARCSVVANGNYANRQNGLSDFADTGVALPPAAGDLPPDDVGRLIDNRQIFVSYGANANCGSPGGRLSAGGGASHSSLDNGSPLRRFANSNSNVYSLFAGLGVFRPGQLQINGSYSTIAYPNRLILPGATVSPVGFNTGVKSYRAGLTYSRPIGTKLTGSIGLSYLTARPDGGQSPYSAPAYDLSLSYRPGTRLSFSAVGSRSIVSSGTAGALFRVVDLIALTTTYEISTTISAHANAGLTVNNYKQPFDIPGEPARRTDSSKLIGLGVNYAPRPLYDVGINVNQTFRNSNSSFLNYNSTRASITLSVHV